MKYFDIKTKLEPLIVFSIKDIFLVDPDFRQATLYDWEQDNKVIKLRNNKYIFSDFRPENYDYYLLSNLIYEPSYISLELALNHYGIIPEMVAIFTAVTTNKTQIFEILNFNFSYKTIRPELFFGYDLLEVKNQSVKIASLEKAILDYLYLNPNITNIKDFEGLRWNKEVIKEKINWNLFEKYLNAFDIKALSERVNTFKIYLES